MIGWLGGMALAAHQVAIAVSTVSFTIYLGLGSAVAIRTSMFKGLQDWRNVRRVTLPQALWLAVLLSVTLKSACCIYAATPSEVISQTMQAVLQIVADLAALF